MKNLKKILALVLAFACAFTMFAGAFTDDADINPANKEAVDTLVALGVLNGYKDGSFRPTATITRAEFAKMMYVVRTGNDNADAHKNANTTFTDVNGTWGAGYIKYCQALGIIAGKSVSQFVPDETVTGEEGAKMLLVTLGYDANKVGLVGHGWGQKAVALADENGLLEDVNAPLSLALPRQDAAQMIYNAINAHTVKLTDGEYSNMNIIGTYYPTVGEKYMGLKKTTSVLTDVEKDGSTYNLTLSDSTDDVDYEETTYDSYVNNTYKGSVFNFTKVATDYSSLKNQKVRVLYKASNNVYGVYAIGDNDSQKGTLGSMDKDGSKLKIDGTKYSVAEKAVAKVDNVYAINLDSGAKYAQDDSGVLKFVDEAKYLEKAFDASAISNTASGKINLLDVTSFVVAKVSYVGKDYISITTENKVAQSDFKKSKLTEDDASWYSDIAKDDYVAITMPEMNADGMYGVTKLDVVTGKITSTKKNQADHDYKVTIDGTSYERAMKNMNEAIALNDTVKIVVKDGYFVYIDDANAVSDEVALVIEVGTSGSLGSTWAADIMFADGTRETVELNKSTGLNGVAPVVKTKPFLAAYSKSSGKYKLNEITSTNLSGYDKYEGPIANNYVDSNKMHESSTIKYINTDATVFVRYTSSGDDAYRIVTGKDMRNWSKSSTFKSYALSSESNGYQYAKVVFADRQGASMPGGADKTYAYLFDYTSTSDNDTDYIVYKAWNGKEDVELKVEDSKALPEGTVVEYNVNSDGVAQFDTIIKKDMWSVGAITGFDFAEMDGTISVKGMDGNTGVYEIDADEDCYVLFVDTDDGSAVASYDIRKAGEDGNGNLIPNVAVWKEAGSKRVIMVIDTVNEITSDKFVSSVKNIPAN